MAFLDAPFRLALGNGESRYYPAHVPIKDRADPGLRFELAQGQSWRWSGKDGPIEVELVDVLALVTALRNGDLDLAECLERQQEAVVDSIDEWQLGELMEPPVRYRTIKNYKLNTPQRLPPPIQVVGNRQTVWLWART